MFFSASTPPILLQTNYSKWFDLVSIWVRVRVMVAGGCHSQDSNGYFCVRYTFAFGSTIPKAPS